MSYISRKIISDIDKGNGNTGCSTSLLVYFGNMWIPLGLVALTGISGSQYPLFMGWLFFAVQITISFALVGIIPDKEGELDSSYLFILSFPMLINLLLINALNLTTMYYGANDVILWSDYFSMLLISLIVTAIISIILGVHIYLQMKKIKASKRKKKKKHTGKLLLWIFIFLPVILILISFALQYFAPQNYINDYASNDWMHSLLGDTLPVPSYAQMSTVASIFVTGILLLLFFTGVQSLFTNPLFPFLKEYTLHNQKKRLGKSKYRPYPKTEENKYPYEYLHQGKMPNGKMPPLGELVRFKFNFFLLDDFTGEMTMLDTTFVDFKDKSIAYHPNLDCLASEINYNHAYQSSMTDEDMHILHEIIMNCGINTWDKGSSIKAKYKTWTICMEFKNSKVYTLSGGNSSGNAYEIEPEINNLITRLKEFRKRICSQ